MTTEQPVNREQPRNTQQPETTQPETTQPETTQPETTQPETTQPSIHPAVRAIIGIAVGIAAGFGALVAWFVGIVTFTGCFISCGTPNELGGMGLMAITAGLVGLTIAAVGYAFIGWSRETLTRLWLIGTGLGAILGIASLVAS